MTRASAAPRSIGLRWIVYTDIARDGMLQHLDFAGLHHVLEVLR